MGGSRSIGPIKLGILAFFISTGVTHTDGTQTSAGGRSPFGSEPAVQYGGIFWTLVLSLAVAIFYAAPQAFLGAELSLMMPENGGSLVWIRRTFGSFIGGINAYNTISWYVLSCCLATSVFASYIVTDDDPLWKQAAVKCGFVFLSSLCNLGPVGWISTIQMVLLVLGAVPFGIMVAWVFVLGDFKPDALWPPIPLQDVEWGLWLAFMAWCYGGYDVVGSLAGDAQFSLSSLVMGMSLALSMAILNYAIPWSFGYMLDPVRDHWVAGNFSNICHNEIGPWAYWVITVAAALAQWAMMMAWLAALYRLVWAAGNAKHGDRVLPGIFSLEINWWGYFRTPIAAIVVVFFVVCPVVVFLPLPKVVEMSIYMRLLILLLEYSALIYLKVKEPNAKRPFKIPFGVVGASLLFLPTLLVTVVILIYANWELLLAAAALQVLFAIIYSVQRLWARWIWRRIRRRFRRYFHNRRTLPEADRPDHLTEDDLYNEPMLDSETPLDLLFGGIDGSSSDSESGSDEPIEEGTNMLINAEDKHEDEVLEPRQVASRRRHRRRKDVEPLPRNFPFDNFVLPEWPPAFLRAESPEKSELPDHEPISHLPRLNSVEKLSIDLSGISPN